MVSLRPSLIRGGSADSRNYQMAISRFTTTQRSLNQSLDRSFNLMTMKTNPTTIVYNPFKIRIDKSRFPFYQIPSLYLSILSLLFPSSTHSYPYSILLLFSTKARARKRRERISKVLLPRGERTRCSSKQTFCRRCLPNTPIVKLPLVS